MEQIKTRIKRWGNSFGVILPKSVIDEEELKDGSEITLTIYKEGSTTAGDLMKLGRKLRLKFRGNIDQKMREIDKELWSER